MTVHQLLDRLKAAFPRAFPNQEAIETWAPAYKARLGNFEGDRLRQALTETLASWNKPGFPRPDEIAANLPAKPRSARPVEQQNRSTRRDPEPHEIVTPAEMEAIKRRVFAMSDEEFRESARRLGLGNVSVGNPQPPDVAGFKRAGRLP